VQLGEVRVRERACLDFEAVVPVAAPQAFEQVAGRGEFARLPLPDDMQYSCSISQGLAKNPAALPRR